MRRGSLLFSQRVRFHVGKRESIYRCMLTILILTLFSFWLFSFFPSHSFLFLFPGFSFQIPISQSRFPFFSPPSVHGKTLFYSACRDRILLFYPLTSFIWFGCISQPSLFCLCTTPHHQTKKGILFAWLSWHLFLLRSRFSLSPYPSWHAPSGSNSACLFWVVSHLNRTPPRNSLSRNLKNRFFPYPYHQTMSSESLTLDHTMPCIGWVRRWCQGLARVFLPYVSKICLLPIRLPWSGGLPA